MDPKTPKVSRHDQELASLPGHHSKRRKLKPNGGRLNELLAAAEVLSSLDNELPHGKPLGPAKKEPEHGQSSCSAQQPSTIPSDGHGKPPRATLQPQPSQSTSSDRSTPQASSIALNLNRYTLYTQVTEPSSIPAEPLVQAEPEVAPQGSKKAAMEQAAGPKPQLDKPPSDPQHQAVHDDLVRLLTRVIQNIAALPSTAASPRHKTTAAAAEAKGAVAAAAGTASAAAGTAAAGARAKAAVAAAETAAAGGRAGTAAAVAADGQEKQGIADPPCRIISAIHRHRDHGDWLDRFRNRKWPLVQQLQQQQQESHQQQQHETQQQQQPRGSQQAQQRQQEGHKHQLRQEPPLLPPQQRMPYMLSQQHQQEQCSIANGEAELLMKKQQQQEGGQAIAGKQPPGFYAVPNKHFKSSNAAMLQAMQLVAHQQQQPEEEAGCTAAERRGDCVHMRKQQQQQQEQSAAERRQIRVYVREQQQQQQQQQQQENRVLDQLPQELQQRSRGLEQLHPDQKQHMPPNHHQQQDQRQQEHLNGLHTHHHHHHEQQQQDQSQEERQGEHVCNPRAPDTAAAKVLVALSHFQLAVLNLHASHDAEDAALMAACRMVNSIVKSSGKQQPKELHSEVRAALQHSNEQHQAGAKAWKQLIGLGEATALPGSASAGADGRGPGSAGTAAGAVAGVGNGGHVEAAAAGTREGMGGAERDQEGVAEVGVGAITAAIVRAEFGTKAIAGKGLLDTIQGGGVRKTGVAAAAGKAGTKGGVWLSGVAAEVNRKMGHFVSEWPMVVASPGALASVEAAAAAAVTGKPSLPSSSAAAARYVPRALDGLGLRTYLPASAAATAAPAGMASQHQPCAPAALSAKLLVISRDQLQLLMPRSEVLYTSLMGADAVAAVAAANVSCMLSSSGGPMVSISAPCKGLGFSSSPCKHMGETLVPQRPAAGASAAGGAGAAVTRAAGRGAAGPAAAGGAAGRGAASSAAAGAVGRGVAGAAAGGEGGEGINRAPQLPLAQQQHVQKTGNNCRQQQQQQEQQPLGCKEVASGTGIAAGTVPGSAGSIGVQPVPPTQGLIADMLTALQSLVVGNVGAAGGAAGSAGSSGEQLHELWMSNLVYIQQIHCSHKQERRLVRQVFRTMLKFRVKGGSGRVVEEGRKEGEAAPGAAVASVPDTHAAAAAGAALGGHGSHGGVSGRGGKRTVASVAQQQSELQSQQQQKGTIPPDGFQLHWEQHRLRSSLPVAETGIEQRQREQPLQHGQQKKRKAAHQEEQHEEPHWGASLGSNPGLKDAMLEVQAKREAAAAAWEEVVRCAEWVSHELIRYQGSKGVFCPDKRSDRTRVGEDCEWEAAAAAGGDAGLGVGVGAGNIGGRRARGATAGGAVAVATRDSDATAVVAQCSEEEEINVTAVEGRPLSKRYRLG